MITGDLNFKDTFSDFNFKQSRETCDLNMAYFIWVLFLVLFPILLSNTLVSKFIFNVQM